MIDVSSILLLLDALGRFVAATVVVPLVVWTLAALVVLGVLRLVPGRPLVQYWMRVSLLLALPLGLAAALLDLGFLPVAVGSISDVPWLGRTLAPIVVDAASTDALASPAWRGPFVGLGAGAVCAGGGAFVAGARLAADAHALHRFGAAHPPNAPRWVQEQVDAQAKSLGINRRVSVCCAPDIAVPMTVGGWHPRLFLPASLLADKQALTMTLTHELVHVHRFDYAVHALVRMVRALFIAHPLVVQCARSIVTYREQACDAAVLATDRVPHKAYAALLLQWAQRTASTPASALGLAYSSSTLKSRIASMTSFNAVPRSHPMISIALSALLLVGTFTLMACDDAGLNTSSESESDDEPYTQVDNPPELDGGMQALYSAMTYPEIAQEHNLEGRVVVQFVVDRDGSPSDVSVIDTPETGDDVPTEALDALEEAAIAAVQQTTFDPGRHEGELVDVQMAVPIRFQLTE